MRPYGSKSLSRRPRALVTATVVLAMAAPAHGWASPSDRPAAKCPSILDRGSHWTSIILPEAPAPAIPLGLANRSYFFDYSFDPENSDTIYIAGEQDIYRSDDAGCRWEKVLSIGDTSVDKATFQCDGLLRELRQLELNSTCPAIYDIEVTPQKVYVQMRYEIVAPYTLVGRAIISLILVSEDDGDTWRLLNDPRKDSQAAATPETFFGFGRMLVMPFAPDTILLERTSLPYTGLFVSYDGGNSWERRTVPSPGATGAFSYLNAATTNPEKPSEAAAFASTIDESGNGLYYSRDEAATWEKLNIPADASSTSSDVSVYQSINGPPQIAFLDNKSRLFYSADGGNSWVDLALKEATSGVNYLDVEFGKRGRFLVIADQASTVIRYDLKRNVATVIRSGVWPDQEGAAAQGSLDYIPSRGFYLLDDCGFARGGLTGRTCRLISRYTGTGR